MGDEMRSKIAAWLDAHLGEDWRRVHKHLTTWLAVIIGAIGGLLALLPGTATELLAAMNALTPETREKISPMIFILLSATPVVSNLIEKARKAKKDAAAAEAEQQS